MAGTNTNLVNFTATITAGTTYTMKLRCVGTGLFAKYWASSGGEPSSWTLTTTDTSTSSGGFGILGNTASGSSGVTFSNFTATDALSQIDISGRAKIAAQTLKNSAGRSRIAAQVFKDLSGRVRAAATTSHDLSLRFLLSSGTVHIRDLSSRIRFLAVSLRDLTGRLRLLASKTRDISALRSRIAAIHRLDSSARSKIAAQALKDGTARSRIAAIQTRDFFWRIILKPLQLHNWHTRTRLQSFRTSDVGTRFSLFVGGGNTFATNPNVTMFGLGLSGSTVLTPTPVGIYAVNGTVLPDTPTLATAPPLQSGTVQVGATFLLLFSSPSGTTTSLLANGSFATLTFPLASGDQVSTTVLIASSSGSMFQAICTVTAAVAVNRYVIITQFF